MSGFFSFLTQHNGPSLNANEFPVLDYTGSGLFSAFGTREFSCSELDSADYFVLFCRDVFSNSNDYLETGEPRVWVGDIKKSGVGSGNQIEIFLENSTKETLESTDLSGLSFRHVIVESRRRTSNIPIVWQIWPEIVLPPMKSPKCDLDGVSLDLDFDGTNGFRINDIFKPQLYLFDKEALSVMDGVDSFRTCEHFGSRTVRARRVPRIIVSRRFRDWCVKSKLRFTWVPVFFD